MTLMLLVGCPLDSGSSKTERDSDVSAEGDSGGADPEKDTATEGDSGTARDTADTGTPSAVPVHDCSVPADVCDESGCHVEGDATLVTISGSLLYNGTPGVGTGEVQLTEQTLDLRVDVDAEPGAYTAVVPPGDWTIEWEVEGMGTMAQVSDVHAHHDRRVNLAEERVTVSGTATWLGGAIPEREDYSTDFGVVFWGETASHGAVTTEDDTWSAEVRTGTYDVGLNVYEPGLGSGGGVVQVADDVAITTDTTMALDAVAARLTARVGLIGRGVDVAPSELWLGHDGGEDWREQFDEGRVTVDLPEGWYGISMEYGEHEKYTTAGWLELEDVLHLVGEVSREYEVPLYEVSGLLSVAGLTLVDASNTIDCPILYAVDAATGNGGLVRCPQAPEYRLLLPEGNYDFSLTAYEYPAGTLVLAEDVLVSADLTHDLTGALYDVSGSLAYDGGDVPLDDTGKARPWTLSFVDGNGAAFDFSYSDTRAWTAQLPAGVYDVWLGVSGVNDELAGTLRAASGFAVPASDALAIDVPLVELKVTATLSGTAPPRSTVWVIGIEGSAAVEIWLEDDGTGNVRVPPGSYQVLLNPTGDVGADSWWLPLAPCVEISR